MEVSLPFFRRGSRAPEPPCARARLTPVRRPSARLPRPERADRRGSRSRPRRQPLPSATSAGRAPRRRRLPPPREAHALRTPQFDEIHQNNGIVHDDAGPRRSPLKKAPIRASAGRILTSVSGIGARMTQWRSERSEPTHDQYTDQYEHGGKTSPRSRNTSTVMCHSPFHFIDRRSVSSGIVVPLYCLTAYASGNLILSMASLIFMTAYTAPALAAALRKRCP